MFSNAIKDMFTKPKSKYDTLVGTDTPATENERKERDRFDKDARALRRVLKGFINKHDDLEKHDTSLKKIEENLDEDEESKEDEYA